MLHIPYDAADVVGVASSFLPARVALRIAIADVSAVSLQSLCLRIELATGGIRPFRLLIIAFRGFRNPRERTSLAFQRKIEESAPYCRNLPGRLFLQNLFPLRSPSV